MSYSYSRDRNNDRKEWFKLISRYVKEEEEKGYEFYCFTLFMNDYNRFVDDSGKEVRRWGNRKDYEENLKYFYNRLNRELFGNSWSKKGLGVKGFICFYEEKSGMKYIKDIGKMNKVKNSHFHIIIKKEKDLSELKLRETIKKLWIRNKNKWNRKFSEEKVELYSWEKNCYMVNEELNERDEYTEDIWDSGFWVGCRSFKFEELYYSYRDVMDKDGNYKREKYSFINYGMKGKWKNKEDISYDVIKRFREVDSEKLSLNSKMR